MHLLLNKKEFFFLFIKKSMIYSRNNDDDTRAGRKTPSSFLPYGDMVRVRCLPFSFSSLFLPDPLQLTARNSLPLDYILLHGENTKKEEKKNLVRYITSPHLSQSITKSHQSGIGEKRIFFTFRFPPFFLFFFVCFSLLIASRQSLFYLGILRQKRKRKLFPQSVRPLAQTKIRFSIQLVQLFFPLSLSLLLSHQGQTPRLHTWLGLKSRKLCAS